jgi:hypothetical protein
VQILENRDAWQADYQKSWLAEYHRSGETVWKLYNRPKNTTFSKSPGLKLSDKRLIFISSAGGYLPAKQPPYDAPNLLGDYSIRALPSDTPLDDIQYAHDHFDHTAVNTDAQVLVPLRHLEALAEAGTIGELAPNFITFMGYQPDVTRVLDETIPAIIRAVKTEGADAAFLVPS